MDEPTTGESKTGEPLADDACDFDGMAFEEAFQGLQEVVEGLERAELSLDESVALYERGVALAERCGTLLEAAELRVRRLESDGADAGPLEV